MRRVGFAVGLFLVLIGMFWSGRESTHGVGAFWEHWWCPIPIVAIAVGIATAWFLARGSSQTT